MARTRSQTARTSTSDNQETNVSLPSRRSGKESGKRTSTRRSTKVTGKTTTTTAKKSNSPSSRRKAKMIEPNEYFDGDQQPISSTTASYGQALKYVSSKESQRDREVVLAAMKNGDRLDLENVSHEMNHEREVGLAAVTQAGKASQYGRALAYASFSREFELSGHTRFAT